MNARERFKESLLFGNPDRVFLFPDHGPREITLRRWHKEGLSEDGGYIPSCDHGIPQDVPYENYCYMMHLIKEIGGWYEVEGQRPDRCEGAAQEQ